MKFNKINLVANYAFMSAILIIESWHENNPVLFINDDNPAKIFVTTICVE